MSAIDNISVDTTIEDRVKTGQTMHAGVFVSSEVRMQWHRPCYVCAKETLTLLFLVLPNEQIDS